MAGKRHRWAASESHAGRFICGECGMIMDCYQGAAAPRVEYRTAEFKFIRNQKAKSPMPPCPGRPEEKKP